MAGEKTVCCICGEKINLTVNTHGYLNTGNEDEKICYTCNFNKEIILGAYYSRKEKNEAEAYFIEFISNKIVPPYVADGMSTWSANLKYSVNEMQEKLKAEQEAQEIAAQESATHSQAVQGEVFYGEIVKDEIPNDAETQKQVIREVLPFLTTGYTFIGYTIDEQYGIVSGDFVMDSGSSKFADVFGGSSNSGATLTEKFHNAKQQAKIAMVKEAMAIGANGVIGVTFDCVSLGGNNVAISANGTAVRIKGRNELTDDIIKTDKNAGTGEAAAPAENAAAPADTIVAPGAEAQTAPAEAVVTTEAVVVN